MATGNTAIDIAIAQLQAFADTKVTDAVFQDALESATDKILQHEQNLTQAQITEIRQLTTRVGDPALQNALRQSYSNLKAQISDSLSSAEIAKGKTAALKNALNKLGRFAGPLNGLTTAAQIADAASEHNPADIGNAVTGYLTSLIGGAIGGIIITAFAGASIPLILAGATFGYLIGEILNAILPASWKEAIGETYLEWIHWPLVDLFESIGTIDKLENELYIKAKNWIPPSDPLILDLNGDGIETSAVAGWDGLKFDHDGDGVKESTGWASSEDGLLALDRNGNGTIDSGRELFGDNTLLSNGELAADAYEALADQDSNNDGKIDASDAVFNDLRVWQDKNQDGISQEDELFTLQELGIKSISTESTSIDTAQNGNTITATSTYERTDGTIAETGSLNFASSNFFTEFADTIEIPEEYQGLPDMHGSGAVRNLREAATLSGTLVSILESYSSVTTRDEQLAKLDQLLSAWAATSGMQSMQERAEDADFVVIYEFGDIPTPELEEIASLAGGFGDDDSGEPQTIAEYWQAAMDSQERAEYQRWFNIISVLERFNGDEFLDFTIPEPDSSEVLTMSFDGPVSGSGGRASGSWHFTKVSISQQQLDLLEQSYEALKESVYGGLVTQTRLRCYFDAVSLDISEAGSLTLDFSGMNDMLESRQLESDIEALTDLIELVRYSDPLIYSNGWDGIDRLKSWIDQRDGNTEVAALLDELHVYEIDENFASSEKFVGCFRNGQRSKCMI